MPKAIAEPLRCSPARKSLPWFVVAWFGPALLAAIGAAVYFLAFPQDFDPSMSTIVATQQQAAAAAGAGDVSADQVRAMLLAQLPFAVFLGPALNIFTTFGGYRQESVSRA